MSALMQLEPQAEVVLAKALLRAAEQLGLKQAELGAMLGLHRTAISRLKNHPHLSPDSKPGELALLIIRVARSLFALTGGDTAWMRHFMHEPNALTGGVPAQQMLQVQGLVTVLQVLDALRGKA
jgi:hypothetical protein